MAIPLTARVPVEFRPRAKPDIVILINVPTPYQRDSFASSLVRGGVVHYSQSQVRDLMLAGVSTLHEKEFEEWSAALQEAWAAGDAEQKAVYERTAREVELREKFVEQYKGKEPTKKQREAIETEIVDALKEIKADVVIDVQKRVAVATLQQDIMSRFGPLQKALGDLAEQKTRRDWLTIETYVAGWKGLPDEPDGNGKGGITRAEAEYLREKLGGEAFGELGDFIFALHSLDEDEEKNLASLLESLSAPTGSTALGSMASSGDGSSTVEPIGGIPVDVSAKTTE